MNRQGIRVYWGPWTAVLASLTLGAVALAWHVDQAGEIPHMAGHMSMTALRPAKPGDQQKADAIVAAAKQAMAPYEDYHKALADGYEIFLPDVPQPQYHFTRYEYGLEARLQFDPLKPTSLLYRKTPDGGYKLIGAMYTDRVDATEEELNERIPLSIARWHQHINFCKARQDRRRPTLVPMQSLAWAAPSPPKKPAMRRAAGSVLISSVGWCMSIPTKQMRRRSGLPTMTTRGTTTWTGPRCRG